MEKESLNLFAQTMGLAGIVMERVFDELRAKKVIDKTEAMEIFNRHYNEVFG